jgi:protein tyrosine phosphatase
MEPPATGHRAVGHCAIGHGRAGTFAFLERVSHIGSLNLDVGS